MKTCSQCGQTYSHDTTFCPSDGSTLVDTRNSQETAFQIQPARFRPPSGHVPIGVAAGGSQVSQWVLVGAIFLVSMIAVGFVVAYFVTEKSEKSSAQNVAKPKDETENTSDSASRKSDDEVAAVERENERLKQQLNEKSKPQQPAITQPQSYRMAYAPRPASRVRWSPNGAEMCWIRTRNPFRVYGATGVFDNNGQWYYTDFCGRTGVIHTSQFNFID